MKDSGLHRTSQANCFSAWSDDYADYLRDESRLVGHADFMAFPSDESDLGRILGCAAGQGLALTLQGARTGITGGAVPQGGAVVNLSRMDRILAVGQGAGGAPSLVVEPGLTLQALNKRLAARDLRIDEPDAATRELLPVLRDGPALFFAPDPTETTASLGGMAACNASGACSFRYGATRNHVLGLKVLLPDAQTLCLRRGRERGRGRNFSLITREGRVIEGVLPRYGLPAVKNAAGYLVADDMELVDLWIGSEGTLGVLAALELQLMPLPEVCWGLTAFFPGDAEALRFVRAARGESGAALKQNGELPAAIEYFDARVLRLIADGCAENESLRQQLPVLPDSAGAAVYIELHSNDEERALAALERLAEDISVCGGDDDATWIADKPADLERLHQFRHAAPELVNLRIDRYRRSAPSLTKLGTDMAVPSDRLEAALGMFQRDLNDQDLDYVIFGHVGDNHFHVNILPETVARYEAGKQLYQQWARQVIAWGGTVSAEHGIGKIKTALLREMLGPDGVAGMRSIRAIFDPEQRFNRGNLFG